MKGFRIGIIIFGLLLLILFIIGLFLPGKYEVSRSETINASRQEILDSLLHLETWPQWSPWNHKEDGSVTFKVVGPRRVAGGKLTWRGDVVGTGVIEITGTHPEKGLTYMLESGNQTLVQYGDITFEDASGGATTVTWTVTGKLGASPVVRWAGMFIDGSLGPPYQQALNALKARLE